MTKLPIETSLVVGSIVVDASRFGGIAAVLPLDVLKRLCEQAHRRSTANEELIDLLEDYTRRAR